MANLSVAKCGYNGTTSFGGEITKWNVDFMCEAVDVSSMSTLSAEEFVGCLQEAQGTFESLIPCGVVGTVASVILSNDLEDIAISSVIITDIDTKADANDVVTFTYTFVSSGEITADEIFTLA